MKAIIIDDEPLARQHVRDCLKSHPEISVVAECGDGFAGIKAIQEHKPDLIFLDIQMPRISGFEMLELLEEPPRVIFTTAFDEFALKAFDANAVDYLLKPFSQERMDKALSKLGNTAPALDKLMEYPHADPDVSTRIVLRHQGEIKIISVADILYIEAWDDYVKIHAGSGVYVKKKTLTFYENQFSKTQFVRCHRSFLVNTDAIKSIDHATADSWELRLSNGFHIPASRQGYSRLKQVMGI